MKRISDEENPYITEYAYECSLDASMPISNKVVSDDGYVGFYEGCQAQLEADQKEHDRIVREIFEFWDNWDATQTDDGIIYRITFPLRAWEKWQALKQKYLGEK